jgi:two-component system cell cycle sensor histidine kinase/response regulator CckA
MTQPSEGNPESHWSVASEADVAFTLQSAFSSLHDGVVVTDQDGRVTLCNPAAQRLLGCCLLDTRLAEWSRRYGLCLPDKLTPFPPELFAPACVGVGAGVKDVELFLRGPDARDERWLSVTTTPLCEKSGCRHGAVLVLRDISETKRAEEAVVRERDWASAVVNTVANLVIVLDREGRVVSFNRACEAATGYTSGEVCGRYVWDLLLLPDEAAAVKHVFSQLRAGHFPNQYENHWVARDGSRRLIAWSNTALVDADGKVEFIIGTGVDVSSRKRAEDELRQANQMLRTIIDTSPLAIITMDFSGNVRSWNRAAECMFGWREQEVIGKQFPIVPEEDEAFFRENLARLRRGQTIAGIERQRRRKDGTLIDVALWNAPQQDADGDVIGGISVIADMTDRRRLEEQFRQSQKMEAVGRLAGGVAHDFNNLLTVISGYTQMLLDAMEPNNAMRSQVEEIGHASESAASLTNQLLAFSRRQIVTPQVLNLNTLVSGMDKMLHRLIGEDVELVTVLAPQLPNVKVDACQFQQVLMNLAVNARDAMPKGGALTIETETAELEELSPDGVPPGQYVVLSVRDTGKGMPEDVRMRVFEPFFTTKGRGKGTGLGLSTVYGIVKQAGGEITVASQPGGGTTFRIFLHALDQAAAATADWNSTPERKRGTETVLLVEDEAGLRKLIRDLLQGYGYTVLQASDFREALEWCQTHSGPIHLFLTDVVMPGMSGHDLATRVTRLRPRLKVLYMSGHTDHAAFEGGLLESGITFLRKPFTPETLLSKVRQVLDAA